MIAEASSRAKESESLTKIRQEEILRDISVKLLSNYNLNILMDMLVESLPRLDIPGCYISLYENTAGITSLFDVPENARLMLAYEKGNRKELNAQGIIYPSKDLLPNGFSTSSKRKAMVVYALNFYDIQLGFVIFELGPEEGSLYFILSNLLSSAIKGALLLDETIQNSEKLIKAYQHLRKNQKKLLATETMASLGRLTGGIAYEINTPLSAILAAMQELKAHVAEYRDSINHPDVLPEEYSEIAKEMEKKINVSKKAAEKSTAFIRGIKRQTASMNTDMTERFIASQVISDRLNLMKFKFKLSTCRLITKIDESIIFLGNPRGV